MMKRNFGLFGILLLASLEPLISGCGRASSADDDKTIRQPVVFPTQGCTNPAKVSISQAGAALAAGASETYQFVITGGCADAYEVTPFSDGLKTRLQPTGGSVSVRYTSVGNYTESFTIWALVDGGTRYAGSMKLNGAPLTISDSSSSGTGSNALICEAIANPFLISFESSTQQQTAQFAIETRRGSTRVNARLLSYYAFGYPVQPMDAIPTASGQNQNVRLRFSATNFEGALGVLFAVEEADTGATTQCAAGVALDVNVPPPPLPTLATVNVSATMGNIVRDRFATVPAGTNAMVTWQSQGAVECRVKKNGIDLGISSLNGSIPSGPIQGDTRFTVSCMNSVGLITADHFDFAVLVVPVLVSVDIKANGQDGSISLPYGSDVLVTWTATSVNSCAVSANSWSGSSGSHSVKLHKTTTYRLDCQTPVGPASDSVTVHIAEPDYQLLFVTRDRFQGNLGGLAGADAKCQAAADASGVMPGRRFVAVMADSNTHGRDRVAIFKPVIRNCSDKSQLALSASDFFDGSWYRAAQCTEYGVHANHPSTGWIPVWTAMTRNGKKQGLHCRNWSSNSKHEISFVGDANDGGDDVFFDGSAATKKCDFSAHLYCLSQ